jgi:hypothetical protein
VHRSRVSFYQVEDKAEECAFARAIIAHQAKQLAAVDGKLWYIDGNLFAESLLEVFNNDFHLLFTI